jgi:hypothetical protein
MRQSWLADFRKTKLHPSPKFLGHDPLFRSANDQLLRLRFTPLSPVLGFPVVNLRRSVPSDFSDVALIS